MNTEIKIPISGETTSGSTHTFSNVGSSAPEAEVSMGHAPAGRASASGPISSAKLENAVYAYIRALRALGRLTATTIEIAQALNLSPAEVESTLATLRKKGVRIE